MAETEERSLDNFFAKREEERKKGRRRNRPRREELSTRAGVAPATAPSASQVYPPYARATRAPSRTDSGASSAAGSPSLGRYQ